MSEELALPSTGDKNNPYKFSRCFSLDMEKGMSPSRLLEDKFLDQKEKVSKRQYLCRSKQH
jgi:hypothetical protein